MSDGKSGNEDCAAPQCTDPRAVTTRRELLVAILMVHTGLIALTLFRAREWPLVALVAVGLGLFLAARVIPVVLIERSLPRLTLAALRGRDEGPSAGRYLVFWLLWMVIGFAAIVLNPSSATLRDWASRAWADVQFWTAAAVAGVVAIGLPSPAPGSLIDRALAQIERLGHFIDEGRFLTREEARPPTFDTPPPSHDIARR